MSYFERKAVANIKNSHRGLTTNTNTDPYIDLKNKVQSGSVEMEIKTLSKEAYNALVNTYSNQNPVEIPFTIFGIDEIVIENDYRYKHPKVTISTTTDRIKCGGIDMNRCLIDNIEKVIFNGPATIVIFKDGSKSMVKCQDMETYDPNLGLAFALLKYFYGNSFNEIFKKYIWNNEE